MTDTKTNENAGSKAPTPHRLSRSRRQGQGLLHANRRCVAAQRRQGFNIQLEVMPLDGRITLRVATDKKE